MAGTADGRRDPTEQPVALAVPSNAFTVDAGPDPLRARFGRVGESDLKSVYLRCNQEALAQRLGSSEIAFCAVAYEVLLKQHFNGEFEALLRWSRGS